MKAKRALALLLSVALAAAVPVGALASDDSDSAGAAATAEEASDPCADGHKYEKTAVEEPTCTDKGTVTYTCSVCGDEYTEDGEDATGHDYNDGEVTKEPTEDSEGVKTFTCKNCGASYTEAIPKLEKKEKEEKSGKKSSDKDKGDDKNSSSGNTKQSSEKSNSSQTGGKDSGNVIDEEEDLKNAAGNGKEEAELLPLWFAGRQVTKADCKDIMGDKSVSYDEASRTLTLNKANYAFTFKDSDDTPAALIVYSCKDKGKTDLTIQLKGENILSASAKKDLRSIIRVENGSLFIKGTGSLFIKGTDEEAALYAKEDIVLFKDAKDDDDAGSLTVDAKTAGLIAGENISVKAGTLSVAAVDKDKDEDDEDRYGTALLAGKDLSVSKDLEIAVPASGKTFTDRKKKLATIVEKGETTPAAKVLIQEPEEDNSKSKSKNVTEEKKDDDGQEIEDSEPAGEEDSAGKKNSSEQEINESEPAGEEDSAEKKFDSAEKKFATNTNLQGTEYPISVNGTKVTDVNKGNIDGSGTIFYDETSNTLTLNGYDPETAQTFLDSFISYTGTTDLNIEIKGTCSIKALKAESADSYKSVIRAEKASLILKGSGSLTIESEEEDAALYSGKNIELFKNDNTPGTLEVESKTAAIKAKDSINMSAKLKIAEQINGAIGKSSDDSYTSIFEDDESDPAKYVLILPTDATTYTVTFASGGAEGSMDPVTVSPGPGGKAKFKLPACGFDQPFCKSKDEILKHGWAFTRWTVNGVYYHAGNTATIEKSTEAKANWKSNTTACVKKQAKVEPTCTESGVAEHYKCSVCGKLFSDANGTTEVKEASLVLPAKGHSYGTPTYAWAKDYSKVTAKHVCTVCTKEEPETVTTTKTGKDATCEEDGELTYTATFSKAGFTTQTKDIKKKALGHKWSETWKWNQNYTKASLTLVCQNDSSHTRYFDEDKVTVSGKISLNMLPTTTSNGTCNRYATITFNDAYRKKYPDFNYTDLYDRKFEDGPKPVVIKPAGKTGYKFVSSKGSSAPTYTWTQNSNTNLDFIVKRNEFDNITFSAFQSISVGGKTVDTKYYTKAKGSLNLKLSATYLKTLSVGTHVLKAQFKDGYAEIKFKVKSSGSSSRKNTSRTTTNTRAATRTSTSTNPRTGDATNWITWLVLAAGSAAVLAIILFVRKRGGKKE